ncbi:MAG: hypothetical protein AAGA99_00555 [Actinomycetota bacterium]
MLIEGMLVAVLGPCALTLEGCPPPEPPAPVVQAASPVVVIPPDADVDDVIHEDDPRWDCRTMGNERCGLPDGGWEQYETDPVTGEVSVDEAYYPDGDRGVIDRAHEVVTLDGGGFLLLNEDGLAIGICVSDDPANDCGLAD